jgi:hypothetical protein
MPKSGNVRISLSEDSLTLSSIESVLFLTHILPDPKHAGWGSGRSEATQ